MTKHHLKASKNKHGLADDIGKPGITPSLSPPPSEPLGLKRRHFMGTALALDAAALLAACGGGGGGGDAAGGGSGSSSSSGSISASSSASGSGSSSSSGTSSSSSSNSGSSSGSGSGSGSAAPTNWVVSTWAGTGTNYPFMDGTGRTATLDNPTGVAVDPNGNVYVAEWSRFVIRAISSTGLVSVTAGVKGVSGYQDGTSGTAKFFYPSSVAVDTSGHLYVADYYNHLIRKISPAGAVSTFAGTVGVAGSANGTGTGAQFNNPSGVAVDTSGHVYVADYSNHLIRKINPAGVVSTLAGSGVSGSANDTGTGAQFNSPSGVALDTNGNLYVADKSNHQIRKITSAGVVSTLAGVGTATSGTADGTGGAATFNSPTCVAVDSGGYVYVADYSNHLIRQINPEGVVSTLAGVGSAVGYVDGASRTARFNNPSGVAVDAGGHIYVADTNNHLIRRITPIYL